MITAKMTHCGQYKRYGDFYHVWEIEGAEEMTKEQVANWCFENLYQGKTLPDSTEFHKNVRVGGEKSHDPGYYFNGYYTISPLDIPGKFILKICKPYAD